MLLFLEVKTWRGVFDLLIRKSEQSFPRHERNKWLKDHITKATKYYPSKGEGEPSIAIALGVEGGGICLNLLDIGEITLASILYKSP